MNIFVLGSSPEESARLQCDKHIVKMPLETAQMLCSALHLCGSSGKYKPTHQNHPCSVWARESRDNFDWLCHHGFALCDEYRNRYGKVHACLEVIQDCFHKRESIPAGSLTPFAQAMPDIYKRDDAVTAYRLYYVEAKQSVADWKFCDPPEWWVVKEPEPVPLTEIELWRQSLV